MGTASALKKDLKKTLAELRKTQCLFEQPNISDEKLDIINQKCGVLRRKARRLENVIYNNRSKK